MNSPALRERRKPFGNPTVSDDTSAIPSLVTANACSSNNVMQLVEAGPLSLDDPLSRFVPSAPAEKGAITIRELLNHRAGFPLGIGDDFEALGRDGFLARAMATPLLFVPGAKESYSNAGYSILAAIIEQVSGKTFDRYVQDAILTPVGMQRTGFVLPGFAMGDLAHGYSRDGEDRGIMLAKAHAPDGPWWNLRGNGGMLSTVADMHAFYAALFGTETLLKAETRNARFNPDEPAGYAGSDGTSFFLYDRFPRMGTELIIASTNAAMKAPAIRAVLASVLGLPQMSEGPGAVVRRPEGKPVSAEVEGLVREFIRTVNAGDSPVLRAFIVAYFDSGPDAPAVDQRLQRMRQIHEHQGAIAIERIETFERCGRCRHHDEAGRGGVAAVDDRLLRPHRIHGVQLKLGG